MSRALAVRFEHDRVIAVVAHRASGRIVVDAAIEAPLGDASEEELGSRLAAALTAHRGNRLPTVVAVPRPNLNWQSYELPPCPPEELPDFVRLQAERDFVLAEDGAGMDFLPLSGDESNAQKVLAIGIASNLMRRQLGIVEAAGLKPSRMTPESFGWARISSDGEQAEKTAQIQVGAAIAKRHTELWAVIGGHIKLVRSVQLPDDPDAAAAVLSSEIGRTIMSVSQLSEAASLDRLPIYVASESQDLVSKLRAPSSVELQPINVESILQIDAETLPASAIELAPLAALAADAGNGVAPAIDLLNPRQPPKPATRRTTYALAAVAAGLLIAFAGWRGYQNIEIPRQDAAFAQQRTEALQGVLEEYIQDVNRVDEIDAWLAGSVNVLEELENLGLKSREKPLEDEDFVADKDVVINDIEVSGRTINVTALARNVDAMMPFEARLRDNLHSVNRGTEDPASEAVPEYKLLFKEEIRRLDDSSNTQGDQS